ncbi:MAG: ABC transporter ATP-binding protein [Alphaproteobacteria bacterium]|nr:ABC transporter ATP-binding protein [Alphaproteobacteria bacterium]
MSSDQAICISHVSKNYLIYDKPEDRLKQMIMPKVQHLFGMKERRYFREFPAVHNVSFHVGRGETVGIVGRNGSGKSTLLQIICGTLQPSAGSVTVNGRIAALLELGSGFNPEFTGRENVYLNAAILGLSKEETDSRFDAIAGFADVGAFMDQPVKTYSSGMYVRLAFAVATNVDPDILIVDEALAVGDEAFQRKCFARIDEIKSRGATILFVSHNPQSIIQLCDRAILMDRGEHIMEGRPKIIINNYQRLLNLTGEAAEAVRKMIMELDLRQAEPVAEEPEETSIPTRAPARSTDTAEAWFDPELVSKSLIEYEPVGVRITDVRIADNNGIRVNNLILNATYNFEYDVEFTEPFSSVNFGMYVKTLQGIEVAGQHAFAPNQGMPVEVGDRYHISMPFLCSFLPGTYSGNCGAFIRAGGRFKILHRLLDAILFRVLPTDANYSRQGILLPACGDIA